MLTLLTKYLLRYKKVCIPNVGTFEIVMQGPQLDVADKKILSPVYITQHCKEEKISDHQFHFLSDKKEGLAQELFFFGETLKRKILHSPFYWRGFGTLRYVADELRFEPDKISLDGWQPVPAEKVLREHVQHHMLVGENHMTSEEVTEVLNKVEYRRPWFITLGWIVFILAVIVLLILLYMKNFQTTSTGLQTRW